MFRNEILNNIIYGNLDESCLNTLIQHDFARLHQEKFLKERDIVRPAHNIARNG